MNNTEKDNRRESFYNDVYAIVAEIPPGKVISYGEIAFLLGEPQHSRMVGRALRLIPAGISVPCHRVVNGQGRTAPGWLEQRQLLAEEGVLFKKNGEVDMKKCGWRWDSEKETPLDFK